jgi:hypothetical protein
MNCWKSFSCSWCYNFCTVNSWKASRMLAYFNSAMLWIYHIDGYALDLLAYTLILLCSDRQLFFGHVSILQFWWPQNVIGNCIAVVYNVVHPICYIFISRWIRETCLNSSSSMIDYGFDGWILLLQLCFE